MSWYFYVGTIVNPKSDRVCEFISEGMLVAKKTSRGVRIREVLPAKQGFRKYARFIKPGNLTHFKHSAILPGFYDMHFHWVQDDVREMPKDSLLQWLDLYTFPTEAKFANASYAHKKAKVFFERILKAGTLGGACYGSIHEHAMDAAMAEVRGDFLIGNVLMNMNSPKALTHTERESIAITKRMIAKFGRRFVFTPRFAISTLPSVMKKGSKLADAAKCFKQSHLSETIPEIEFVLGIYRGFQGFEKVKSYTEIYQKCGMLGPRSLMGHGIHLSAEELKTLARTRTTLIHCPTSNAPHGELGLGSGLFNFKKVERANVRWALGSDIGGGPFLSMFDVMRSFVEQNARAKVKGATYKKALYRATLAGAEILGFGKRAGNLSKGKELNFIVVPYSANLNPKNAEALLKAITVKHRGDRRSYDQVPSHTFYRGEKACDARA